MSRGGRRSGMIRRDGHGMSYPPNPTPILEARQAPGVELVTQFQTGHGWGLLGGTTGNVNDPNADPAVGTQCAWWSGNGDGSATGMRRAGGPAYDLTNKDIGILIRVDEPNDITPGGGVSFIFYAGNGTFTNYLTFDLTSAASIKYFPRRSTSGVAFGGSWVYITIPTDTTTNSWTAKGGAQTVPQILANVTDWQFLHRDPNPSAPSRISVQEIFLVPKQTTYPNGVCCLTFDDGFQSTYTKAAPIVAAVGGRATSYIIKNQIDTANFMTLAQAKDLQDTYGWALASHSYLGIDHEAGGGVGFTDMTAAACMNDIQQLRAWMKANGFTAYDHLAYPHGAYCIEANGDGNINDRVDVTLSQVLKSARTLYGKFPETIPLSDHTKMRVWTATSGSTTLATLKAQADVAKRCKSAMVIVFHEIIDVGPAGSSQWLTADLQALVTYINSLGIPLRTVEEVFEPAASFTTPDSVWTPLTAMSVTNPMDYGAVGDGSTNDLAALQAAVTALPSAGGVVYFPPGKTFRKNAFWDITKDHVKLWRPCSGYTPGREATINAFNADAGATQSIRWLSRVGGGAFGIKFVSDATARKFTFEDMGLVYRSSTDVETVGCEIVGSAAASVNVGVTQRAYQEHNYIHDSFADGIFQAYDSDSSSYNWGNFGYLVGDDFVSIVTDLGATRPHDIDTWLNTIVNGAARGFSVIGGGPGINIRDNWAVGCGAAGIIVASESSFNSEGVDGVAYSNNKVYQCCQVVTSHSGILISAGNPGTTLQNIAGTNNWSVSSGAQPYRTEAIGGTLGGGITSTGLQTTIGSLPTPIPVAGDAAHGDTTVLRTRDVSHVAVGQRPGLYRIHVKGAPGAFQQRFEYVVKGTAVNVAAFCASQELAGEYVSTQIDISGTTYALVLTQAPITIPGTVTGVTFAELRTLDLAGGNGSVLWTLIDSGAY